jgi:hypothetical protein
MITSFVVEKSTPFDFRVDIWQHQNREAVEGAASYADKKTVHERREPAC